MNKNTITILLVDTHLILRKGMALFLNEEENISVVGEVDNSGDAIKKIHLLKPHIVLIEYALPDFNSIALIQTISSKYPKSKIITFSKHSDKQSVDRVLSAGAMGYLLKESKPEELLTAIDCVIQGKIFLSYAISNTILEAYINHVSTQQKEPPEILRTKLHTPPITQELVARPHLIEYLNARRVQPLILVSAPAGYGKSTLISHWLDTCDWSNAWISLDKSDHDLQQFLLYFLTAIEDIFPNSCQQSLVMSQAPQLPSLASLTMIISNELEGIEQPFFLVLDDYHQIHTQSPVNNFINLLLNRPPLPFHLIIITRRDPPVHLVTLRASNQITEIRMNELCFNRIETKQLLKNTASFSANDNILDNLTREIEGWVVGLQLVSQVLRSHHNQQEFLQNLNHGVQQTNAYLLHEVFIRQAPHIQKYMLYTSILNRFCVPLCEALHLSQHKESSNALNAQQFIHELNNNNLFTISLDLQGQWFRFHHLFQQLLQNELKQQMSSTEILALHQQAGHWFHTHHFIDEAIEHFILADDPISAAEIIEQRHWRAEQDVDSWQSHKKWLAMIPDTIKAQRPNLLISQLWIMHDRYQLHKITPIIQQLEVMYHNNLLDSTCIGGLKLFQGMLCYWSGKGEVGLQLLLDAQKILPKKHPRIEGLIDNYISITRHITGQEKTALRLSNQAIKTHHSENKLLSSRLYLSRSLLHASSGNLQDAVQDGQTVSHILAHSDSMLMKGWGDYIAGISYFRLNNLSLALEKFYPFIKNKYNMHTRVSIDALIGLALTQQAMQQENIAKETMADLQQFVREIKQADHLLVAQSGQARLALLQGNLDQAVNWLNSINEKPTASSMFLWLENPIITQTRVLIALGSNDALHQATKILSSLLQEVRALHNTCQIIEILILQVVALEQLGQKTKAISTLKQVIIRAEPGQWLRPFMEQGKMILPVLKRFIKQTASTDYINLIITHCKPLRITHKVPSISAMTGRQGEDLTHREIEILELLTQRMQNKEIARKLFVSPETIKTHLKHLYQKLGVNNRREAANIAQDFIPPYY